MSCHGPDPTQNRNRLLLAADRPQALLRALNTVSVMGYMRSELADADVADLSAYLGRVQEVSSDEAPVALWPATVEFGAVAPGESSAVFRVRLANRSPRPLALPAPPRAPAPLALGDDCPASLAPGAACELRLQLSAGGTIDAGGGLGWALPELGAPLVTAWSAVARPAGALVVEPEGGLDFGEVAAGRRVDKELLLRSTGNLPVTLGLATLTGPDRARFELGTGCAAGTVLPPGSTCSLTVSYQPAVTGRARAGLQWRSDGRNPGNLMLDGRAIAAPAPAASSPPAASPSSAPPAAPTPPGASPVGGPAPAPTAAAVQDSGGGGCSVAAPVAGALPAQPRPDPLWPLMVLGAAWALSRRHRAG